MLKPSPIHSPIIVARHACRRAAALACLFAALWAGASMAVQEGAQPENAAITEVELEAPEEVQPLLDKHMEALRQGGRRLDDAARLALARNARKEIEELLATEGYFRPEVEVRDSAEGATRRIVIRVVPGPRASVADVRIEFAGDIAADGEARERRRAALREAWTLKSGEPFRQALWDESKQTLLRLLQAEDYAAARLEESRAEVDPALGRVTLHVLLDSGPAFTVGRLDISGLGSYSPELVERYNPIRPGEPYSQERLLKLQSALQNSPYFGSVLVEVDADPAHTQVVPIRVRLSESRPQRLGFGVGYSTNTGVRGEVNYRHANFLGHAWNLNSAFRWDKVQQIAYADIYLPPTSRDHRDSFGVLSDRNSNQGLTIHRRAIGAIRTHLRGHIETQLGLNFQRETRTVDGQPGDTNDSLTLNWAWTRRNVDDPFNPRTGDVINVQFGGGLKALLSAQDFYRSYLRYQLFLPVGRRDVLTLRAEAGYTAALDRNGIPEDFLFRTGGAQTVRGYDYQSLGVEENGAIVGGRVLAIGSAEYVHWLESLGGDWGAAVFYDAGNAVDTPKDYTAVSGAGVGARWRSPAGPLGVDFAYGERERKWRMHFALSIAF